MCNCKLFAQNDVEEPRTSGILAFVYFSFFVVFIIFIFHFSDDRTMKGKRRGKWDDKPIMDEGYASFSI
jgi:hypothetical protein